MTIDIRAFQEKLYFTAEDVAQTLDISPASAHVLCSRYVKKGLFIRVKKDFYALHQNWIHYDTADLIRIANHLQTPSYVSLASALSYHGLTTQVQRNWIESVGLKRTVQFEAAGTIFRYFKLQERHYFGFIKENNMFIAVPEKAFADACHLIVYGQYALDWSACDFGRLNRDSLAQISRVFPKRTQQYLEEVLSVERGYAGSDQAG